MALPCWSLRLVEPPGAHEIPDHLGQVAFGAERHIGLTAIKAQDDRRVVVDAEGQPVTHAD